MDKTQNFFEKVRDRLKQYRFNRETQSVERDEFSGRRHVDRRRYLSNKRKKRAYKMRGAAVVASAFFVLVGAGVVDAQTKGLDMLNLGGTGTPVVTETASNSSDSGKTATTPVNNAIGTAPAVISQTTGAVAAAITETITATDEPVPVAAAVTDDSEAVNPAETATVVETPAVVTPAASTPSAATISVAEVASDRTMMSEPAAVETPAAEPTPATVAPVETPAAVDTPVTPVVEAPAEAAPDVSTPAVDPSVDQTPVVEIPAADPPVVDTPVVESPVEETTPVETPQAQFVLPASGRIGEIFRDYDSGYYSNHNNGAAVDILNSAGTPVHAAASGTVTLAGWYGGYGNCVVIDHGNGYSTLYGHFNSLNVSVGQSVSQGDVIGQMGSTGSSTANHVHFEIMINGVAQPIGNFFSISTGDYV